MKKGSVIGAVIFVLLGAAFVFIALAVSGPGGGLSPEIEQMLLGLPLAAQGIARGIFTVAGGIAGALPIADILQFNRSGGLYFYMLAAAVCLIITVIIIMSSVSAARRVREMAERSRRAKANKPKVAPDHSPVEKAKPASTSDGKLAYQQSQAMGRSTMSEEESQASADEMTRLIQWEQSSLGDERAEEVISTMYPGILEWKSRFRGETLRDLATHMLAIARNKLKLRDKGISPYQFSSFQNRVYQLEEEVIVKLFAPADPSMLNAEHRDRIGAVVDKKTWRIWQQEMLVDKDEWKDVSVKNALALLAATQPSEATQPPPQPATPPSDDADAE